MTRGGFTRSDLYVIVLTGAGHFATHFYELMFPTLAVPIAVELGLPFGEVLGWSFAGYLLFGIGALPAGFVADKFGARRLLLIGVAGMGVCSLAAAEATPGRSLAICLAGLGLFASVYHPAGMSLISHTIPARGRALGINGICGNLGIAAAPMLTALLVTHFGTREAFAIAGFAGCALAAALSFLPVEEQSSRHLPSAPADRLSQGHWGLFALLCGAAMLAGISYRGNTVIQPAYFAERVSLLAFGTVTSLVYLIGVAGQYVGGTLADRYDLRWLYFSFHAASLPALFLMTLLVEMPLVAVAAVFLFFSLGMQPIENSLFARFSPPRWRGTGYGVKFVLTFGVGAFAIRLVQWSKADGELSSVLLYLCGVVTILVAIIAAFVVLSRHAAGEISASPPGHAGPRANSNGL